MDSSISQLRDRMGGSDRIRGPDWAQRQEPCNQKVGKIVMRRLESYLVYEMCLARRAERTAGDCVDGQAVEVKQESRGETSTGHGRSIYETVLV